MRTSHISKRFRWMIIGALVIILTISHISTTSKEFKDRNDLNEREETLTIRESTDILTVPHLNLREVSMNTSKDWNDLIQLNKIEANVTKKSVIDLESTDCTKILEKFRADDIAIVKNIGDKDYRRSFVAVNVDTDKPFYVSTHDEKIDSVRAIIIRKRRYYETELTKRVVEIFEEKDAAGKESIMLDVGANIGWFSLVAAAHGATKVYAFEPNLQNTVRFCESLALNRWLHDDRSQDFVIPISKGAGAKEENRTMYAAEKSNPGAFTFQEGNKDQIVGDMEITTLDLFAERHGWFESKPCIALFKLDVERFELEVFQGAKKLLKSRLIERIAMEFKVDNSKERKSEMIQLLLSSGYEI